MFSDIKAGDTLIVTTGVKTAIHPAERTTKTQIIISGLRFRRSDGCLVGRDNYSRSHIHSDQSEEARKNLLVRIKKQKLFRKIEGYFSDKNSKDISLYILEGTVELIDLEEN